MGDIIARLNSTEGNPTPYILIGIAVWCLIWFAFLRRWLNRPGAGKISSFLADLGFYGCLLSAVFFGFMMIFVIATVQAIISDGVKAVCAAVVFWGILVFLAYFCATSKKRKKRQWEKIKKQQEELEQHK